MHPILLVGAALVGLPVLLHLIMKQEPKRLPFPAFRFLQQRVKTNQRKLRLRHFLLLALRMLLIALFALALYQPTVLSEGLNLTGEQPLAVVVVVDTSPSMGYADGKETRLEEACRRALELVNELPDGSRVAVVETGDPGGDWLPSLSDARSRLEALAKRAQAGTVGGAQPVTAGVAAAYQLLKTVDAESDGSEPLPRVVAVFTDRAAASWDPARVEDLKKLRDAVPDPKPLHAVVDVGADRPLNVALTAAEMTAGRSQVVPANQPAGVTVTVAAAGLAAAPATVRAYLDDAREPLTKEVAVPDGQSRAVAFEFRDLKPGLHQVRFELETKDALLADNSRYFTFRTAEPRRVLTFADDPDAAAFWKLALDAKGEFAAEVVKPEQVRIADGRAVVTVLDPADPTRTRTDDLAGFEAVVLFEVGRPATLWDALRQYVEAGGKLVIVPPAGDPREYNGEAAVTLMPGELKGVINTAEAFPRPKDPKARDRSGGVVWTAFGEDDDRALQHPLLAPFRDWKRAGNIDFLLNPPRVQKYWEVEPRAGGEVIARYDDDDDPAKRHPAVLERAILDAKDKTPKGKVILLATRLHVRSDADPEWNEYWSTTTHWPVVFPELLLRAAAGSTAEVNFNYQTGQTVTIPLARLLAGKRDNLSLEGPGIAVDDAVVRPSEWQTELRLGPPRTNTPGNFVLSGPAPDWREGFSLDLPADESTLAKVPAEGVEELTGAGTVIPVGKDVKLTDVLTGTEQFKTPMDLFPWLLIAVLLLLVFEAFLANRFYRRPR